MQARVALGFLCTSLVLTTHAGAQTPPRCQRHEALVYEPGCEGPGRLVCSSGVSLPATSDWCACDGHTVTAPSMSPPAGLRYRFAGSCGVLAGFEALFVGESPESCFLPIRLWLAPSSTDRLPS